jgi:hypothetical protein
MTFSSHLDSSVKTNFLSLRSLRTMPLRWTSCTAATTCLKSWRATPSRSRRRDRTYEWRSPPQGGNTRYSRSEPTTTSWIQAITGVRKVPCRQVTVRYPGTVSGSRIQCCGSGMGKQSGSGSGIRIRDKQRGAYFRELRNNFLG